MSTSDHPRSAARRTTSRGTPCTALRDDAWIVLIDAHEQVVESQHLRRPTRNPKGCQKVAGGRSAA